MNINGQKVIVVGTGKSGIGSAVLLEQNGALPILCAPKGDYGWRVSLRTKSRRAGGR